MRVRWFVGAPKTSGRPCQILRPADTQRSAGGTTTRGMAVNSRQCAPYPTVATLSAGKGPIRTQRSMSAGIQVTTGRSTCGEQAFCALTADGEATSGNHGYLSGDCGLASDDGSARYTALAVGRGYNCAITDSGTAVCAEDDRWQWFEGVVGSDEAARSSPRPPCGDQRGRRVRRGARACVRLDGSWERLFAGAIASGGSNAPIHPPAATWR